jgi:hypothetical protein
MRMIESLKNSLTVLPQLVEATACVCCCKFTKCTKFTGGSERFATSVSMKIMPKTFLFNGIG